MLLSPLVGLLPVIGDFAGLVLSLYLVQTAAEVHLPQSVLSQMMMNIIIDFLIGKKEINDLLKKRIIVIFYTIVFLVLHIKIS